ncbi:MAG: BlaI/MecI/CopY family transcriptional regulator [Pseudomonadota bacterium]
MFDKRKSLAIAYFMKITDAESVVLGALWNKSPQTAEELVSTVGPEQGWEPPTVRTLITRLRKKGAIASEKDGRRFLFRPALSREEYLDSTGVLERAFAGEFSPLVSYFADRKKLSKADIAQLREMIERWDDDD